MGHKRRFRGTYQTGFDIHLAVDDNATVAVIKAEISDGKFVTVTASAKREPGDEFDPQVGSDLATARALRKIADKIERQHRNVLKPTVIREPDPRGQAPEGFVELGPDSLLDERLIEAGFEVTDMETHPVVPPNPLGWLARYLK